MTILISSPNLVRYLKKFTENINVAKYQRNAAFIMFYKMYSAILIDEFLMIYFMPCTQVEQVAYPACGRRSVFDYTTGRIRAICKCIPPPYRLAPTPCNKENFSRCTSFTGVRFALCGKGGNSSVHHTSHFGVSVMLLRLGERKRHSVDYIELLLGAEQGNYRPIYAWPYIKYAAIANLTTLAASGWLVARSE